MPRIQVSQLLRNLTTAIVLGSVSVLIVISTASLVYAAAPPEILIRGIGFSLFGATVICGFFAFTSSMPGVVAYPQDNPAAILGLATAAIVATMAPSAADERLFATVVAAVIISSLLTVLTFLLLGTLGLGNLVRYIPYPVIGGFLAGTGALMIQGALRSMTGTTLSLLQPAALLDSSLLIRWLPGLALGMILQLTLRRHKHFLLLPAIVLAAIGIFYLANWLGDVPHAEILRREWLLGPLPGGSLWRPPQLTLFADVDWPTLAGQAGILTTIPAICTLAFLLNSSGMEVIRQRDIDINRDLRFTGIANLLAALGGSHVGYTTVGTSTLAHQSGSAGRALSFCIALIFAAMLFAGASVLSYMPKFVLGGIVIYLGLDFLTSWLYDGWRRLGRADYLIVVSILVAISTLGLLTGVGLGVALTVGMFVVEYSQAGVVKHTISGALYRSTVDRSYSQRNFLGTRGDQFVIFELQSFIFFGSANSLLEEFRQQVEATGLLWRYAILDFRHVTGIDTSALQSFVKLKRIAALRDIVLVFTHLGAEQERQLRREVLLAEDQSGWRIFPDLDHGVEWCEEQLLRDADLTRQPEKRAVGQLALLFTSHQVALSSKGTPDTPDDSALDVAQRLVAEMVREELVAGQLLIRQGEPALGLYLLESGQLTVQLEQPDGRALRLRSMQTGVFVGELGLYTNHVRSASVVADEPCVVYYLAAEQLAQLLDREPRLAAAFHGMIAHLVSERLVTATNTLGALLR